jgi:hypothetical protein
MIWKERKKRLEEEKQRYQDRLEILYEHLCNASPREGTEIRREMSKLERRIFALDYLFLVHEHPGLELSPDTRDFLDALATYAKEKPDGTIRIKDYVRRDFVGIKQLINEARAQHVLEMRMEENTEFTGYILRNDYANKHQTVMGDRGELKEIMRSPI